MMRLFLTSVLVLITLYSMDSSHGVIEPVNSDSFGASQVSNGFTGFSDGEKGDYTLLLCSTASDGNNTINDLSTNPAEETDVTELDNSQCEGGTCVMGVWGIFSRTNSYEFTCSWSDSTTVFAGGFFRFSGVDFNNPLIDVKCDSGFGPDAIAPSIITEDNSRVVRFFAINLIENGDTSNSQEEDSDLFFEVFFSDTENITAVGTSERFDTGGPTGTSGFGFGGDSNWRACTIGLRMQGNERIQPIPTLSEWGLIAMTGLIGIVGLLAIRRKKAAV